MASNSLIAPSILSADFSILGEQIRQAELAGADWLHIDVMDGHFVPNISLGPLIVDTCKRITNIPLDVHLMIDHPDQYIDVFAEAGAHHITVHIEASENIVKTLKQIHQVHCKAGVVLKPKTKVENLGPALEIADIALVMSVEPGFGGQAFIPKSLDKVRAIRKILDEQSSSALIEIDGGINVDNVAAAQEAGVDVFVAGSAIFNHPEGIESGIRSIQKILGIQR